MSIWHAYHIIATGNGNDPRPDDENVEPGVTIKDLRQMARLVSKFSGEKAPTNILSELDRTFGQGENIQFPNFQSLLVNKYR